MKHKGDNEKIPDGLGVLMSAYDWKEAMTYAKFTFQDVGEIIIAEEGENDERDWKLIVRLKSGKWGWLSAGCDYSGWDCQAGGDSGIVDTIDEANPSGIFSLSPLCFILFSPHILFLILF